MSDPNAQTRRPILLINAESLPRIDLTKIEAEGGTLIVAGSQIVDMTLAELALPGALMIWTDFSQSNSLGRLHAKIDSLGGLDHLILAGDGAKAETMFSLMCAILSLLPALRRPGKAQVSLLLDDGPAVSSLQEFLTGLASRLSRYGISVVMELRQPSPVVVG